MYTYIASKLVGDVKVSLLRTVPIFDRGTVFRIYYKPQYIHLSRFSFDTVDIILCTETGKIITFDAAASVVMLHFRSRRKVDLE
jgi:hypothetical protein